MGLNLGLFYLFNNLAGRSKLFDDIVVFLASYLQYFLVLFFILLLYFSLHPKRKKIYIFSVTIISALFSRAAAEIIRFFYHHPRPFVNHPVHQLLPESGWSFPSGHSSFFFAMATAIYFYNKKWGLGFFIAALFMNISRIIAGVHYPLDILGGMILGIAAAWFVAYFAKTISRQK